MASNDAATIRSSYSEITTDSREVSFLRSSAAAVTSPTAASRWIVIDVLTGPRELVHGEPESFIGGYRWQRSVPEVGSPAIHPRPAPAGGPADSERVNPRCGCPAHMPGPPNLVLGVPLLIPALE